MSFTLYCRRSSHVIIIAIILLQLYDVGVTEGAAEELRPENCWFTSRKSFLLAFLIPYWLILIATIYYIVRGILAIRWAAALAPTRKVCADTFLSNNVFQQHFLFLPYHEHCPEMKLALRRMGSPFRNIFFFTIKYPNFLTTLK